MSGWYLYYRYLGGKDWSISSPRLSLIMTSSNVPAFTASWRLRDIISSYSLLKIWNKIVSSQSAFFDDLTNSIILAWQFWISWTCFWWFGGLELSDTDLCFYLSNNQFPSHNNLPPSQDRLTENWSSVMGKLWTPAQYCLCVNTRSRVHSPGSLLSSLCPLHPNILIYSRRQSHGIVINFKLLHYWQLKRLRSLWGNVLFLNFHKVIWTKINIRINFIDIFN